MQWFVGPRYRTAFSFYRLGASMAAEYVLELGNVFHSGQVVFFLLNFIHKNVSFSLRNFDLFHPKPGQIVFIMDVIHKKINYICTILVIPSLPDRSSLYRILSTRMQVFWFKNVVLVHSHFRQSSSLWILPARI
jgi:hypothetical protein